MSAIISVNNLSKTYTSGLQALNNINRDIRRGVLSLGMTLVLLCLATVGWIFKTGYRLKS